MLDTKEVKTVGELKELLRDSNDEDSILFSFQLEPTERFPDRSYFMRCLNETPLAGEGVVSLHFDRDYEELRQKDEAEFERLKEKLGQ